MGRATFSRRGPSQVQSPRPADLFACRLMPRARERTVTRSRAPVLAKMDLRWSWTVCSDSDIWRAMARVSLPVASRSSSSCSRVVRPKARLNRSRRSAADASSIVTTRVAPRSAEALGLVGGTLGLVGGREPGRAQGEPETAREMRPCGRRVIVDTFLGGQDLGGHVVDAGRDGSFIGCRGKQHIQPCLRSRRAGDDPKVVVQRQHDRPGVVPLRSCWLNEGSRLALSQRFSQRRGQTGDELGVGAVERFTGAVTPQVEEAPAAVLVGEDYRGHVTDSVPAHHLSPDPAPRQITADRIMEEPSRGCLQAQGGPAVDGRCVLGLDEGRQLGDTGHLGEGRGTDRRSRIGKQPDVSTEVDHFAKNAEDLPAQISVLEPCCAEGGDALAGSGPCPRTGHQRSVRRPGLSSRG